MDATALDRRARTFSGFVPPPVVSRLLELGQEAEVELQAGRGEWFCALEWARLVGGRGRQDEALEVLAPYVDTGWWTAVEAQVLLLEDWGRVEEAVAQARPYARVGGFKLELLARLLARHGRLGEAVPLLIGGIDDPGLASALVELTEGAGLDEEIAPHLTARIPVGHRCDEPWCCRGLGPDTAIGLLATVRERQGRVDEAIALLHTQQFRSRDQLADLLARQGRIGELRTYAESEPDGYAARRLAELLEEAGDVNGAIAVYRQPLHRPPAEPGPALALALAELLARQNRRDEAIDALRTLADSPDGTDDWVVDRLCSLYADLGRPADGLAHLDTLTEEDRAFFVLPLRLRLMAACGRLDEAIGLARAQPGGSPSETARTLAELLAGAGRVEEAVAVLEPHGADHPACLAGHLIALGRVGEALALFRRPEPEPFVPVWSGTFAPDGEGRA
ncbi:tetratricopeptide repeat protein [Streptomyces sp. NPDC090077]|uniref:tetratricopeptide repeat protein n=1 Tax=Streptomyces sp. NPDC090077 TaxID=3365938 RepID=UPI0038167A1A